MEREKLLGTLGCEALRGKNERLLKGVRFYRV